MSVSYGGNHRFRPLSTQRKYGLTEPEMATNGKPGILKIYNWQDFCWQDTAIFQCFPNIFAGGSVCFLKILTISYAKKTRV